MLLIRGSLLLSLVIIEALCGGEHLYDTCNSSESVIIGNRGLISFSTNETSDCRWIIKIPHPGGLTLILEELDIHVANGSETRACHSNALEISTKGRETVYKLCGNQSEQMRYKFSSAEVREVEINFKTNFSSPDSSTPAKFAISYTIACDLLISGQRGQFASPNYPNRYFDGLRCTTRFNQPSGTKIRIYFAEVNVKSEDANCLQDYIGVIRGSGNVEKICNKKLPQGNILIDPNKDVITFVSSGMNGDGDGFVGNWTAVPAPVTPTTKKTEDLAWIALVFFAILTLGIIIFITIWATKKRPQNPDTPESQHSSNVFKFDDSMERQHSFRAVGSDPSSLRSSVRGRISRKWNINESVLAKKRALRRQCSDDSGIHSRIHSLSRSAVLRQTSLDDAGTYMAMNQFSPPPRYDTFFGQYSTRRARVPQSPYIPRSAGHNVEFSGFTNHYSLDVRSSRFDAGFDQRRAASVRETRKIWRSTDSIPERWRVKSHTSETKTGNTFQNYTVTSPVTTRVKDHDTSFKELENRIFEQIENNARSVENEVRRSSPNKASEKENIPNATSDEKGTLHSESTNGNRSINENAAEDQEEIIVLVDKPSGDLAHKYEERIEIEDETHENLAFSDNEARR